jgi:hypothetical protein
VKPRKCKAKSCGIAFTPQRMGQHACSPLCAVELARAKREQAETRARSDARKADRQKREKLKTRSDWIKETRDAVHKYVRLRDSERGCISCGCALCNDYSAGGRFDAGHFRSVGSAPHLRFEINNIHGQCKRCNRYLAGNAIEYRAGLVDRYGTEFVAALEADQEPRKYDIDELRAIRDHYRQEARKLEKQ